MWYKNIAGMFFGLVTKHACDRQTDRRTDGQVDRQNYDSQDRASIAASRGKNEGVASKRASVWHLGCRFFDTAYSLPVMRMLRLIDGDVMLLIV